MTFDLDANGILTVTAMDQVTKATANITISNTVGHLSKDEIEKMLENAERVRWGLGRAIAWCAPHSLLNPHPTHTRVQMKKEDEALLARLEARNELEQAIYYAKEAAVQRDSARIMNAAKEVRGRCARATKVAPRGLTPPPPLAGQGLDRGCHGRRIGRAPRLQAQAGGARGRRRAARAQGPA